MPADFPFDREVDAAHAEAYRARQRGEVDPPAPDPERVKRLVFYRRELRRAAGIALGRQRKPGSPKPTERAVCMLTKNEAKTIKRGADAAMLSFPSFMRACALYVAGRIEGEGRS